MQQVFGLFPKVGNSFFQVLHGQDPLLDLVRHVPQGLELGTERPVCILECVIEGIQSLKQGLGEVGWQVLPPLPSCGPCRGHRNITKSAAPRK